MEKSILYTFLNHPDLRKAIQLLCVIFFLSICFTQKCFAIESWALGNSTANTGMDANLANTQREIQALQQAVAQAGGPPGAATSTDLDSLRALQSKLPQSGGPTPVTGQLPQPAKKPKITQKEMSEGAFSNIVSTALPMSPEQIVRLHSLFNATQRAVDTLPGVPPKPVSRILMIDLSPGATPPVIRLYAGFISSLVFVDSTGAPWPVQAYDLGNPKAFNISWNKKDNILMIQAVSLSTIANLLVKVQGLPTPIMLTLVPDQVAVDYRVDLHVPGIGPNATALPISNGLPEAANTILLGILNGVPPVTSKVLDVAGSDCQAWLYNKKLYLRTRYKVLSPGWMAVMSSADGTNAYELPRTPFVLLTGHGKTIPLKITGF